MSSSIYLADIRPNKLYVITDIKAAASEYSEKLEKMGFVCGTPLELAPVKLQDPMVVMIRGSRIALRKEEARAILVKEIDHA